MREQQVRIRTRERCNSTLRWRKTTLPDYAPRGGGRNWAIWPSAPWRGGEGGGEKNLSAFLERRAAEKRNFG